MPNNRKNLTDWMTQSEYSRRTGFAMATIHDAIEAGRLETNGQSGRACRVRGRLIPAQPAGSRKRKIAATQQKTDLELEKVRVDVELKMQRLEAIQREQRRTYMSCICAAFLQAFAPFKGKLVELRLSPEQLADLQNAVESALKDFETLVRQNINGEDVNAAGTP